MNISGCKILVTGGAGYIGSHTVVQLIRSGYKVIVFDNLCNSKIGVIDRIESITGERPYFINGDIRDRFSVRRALENHEIECVIHFAALKSIGDSVAMPLEYYDNNVAGGLILIEEMKRRELRSFIFSSSASVYGAPSSVPIAETAPLKTTNPYAQSKLIFEGMLRDLYKSDSSWRIALLRYFNPVGAHSSGLLGENPSGIPTNLFPILSQVAAGKRDHLLIYGADYPTRDGTGVRDYIHVEDLANGHLAAISALNSYSGVLTVNLGTGCGYSVLEAISTFEKVAKVKIKYQIVDRRPGDVPECYADPTLAMQIMKWGANFGLERMCVDAWRWQQMNCV